MTLGEMRFYCVGEETLWRLPEEGGDSLEIVKFMLQGDLSGGGSSYRSWRSDPDILYHDNCLYVTADMQGTGTELVQVNLITPLEIVIIGPNSVNAGSRGFFDGSATGMDCSLPLPYQWLQKAGTFVYLANANTPFVNFQAPIDATDGDTLTF